MKNKTWFITGASQGFGLALVKHLLENNHQVIATSRTPHVIKLQMHNHPHLLALKVDITDQKDVNQAVKQAIDKFGGIDILVNNAGYGQLWTFEESSEAEIRKCLEINLFGTMNVTRAILPIMRQQKHGHIFNTSSAWGYAADPYISTYAAAKFAIDGWTESLAQELKPLGITASSVKPGGFETNFLQASSMVKGESKIPDYQKERDAWMTQLEALQGKLDGDAERYAAFLVNLTNQYADLPIHIFAGRDCYARVENKIAAIQDDLELLRKQATDLHIR